MGRFDHVLHSGDPDEHLRFVDRVADAADWDELVDFRRACRAAAEVGIVAWPARAWAAHRLCLDGPAELAVDVLGEPATAFGLGPLSEVAAQHHTWAELGSQLPPGPVRAEFAVERVLRGEDLRDEVEVDGMTVTTPMWRTDLETTLALPTYDDAGITVEAPAPGGAFLPVTAVAADPIRRPEEAALEVVAEPVVASGAVVRTAAVEGELVSAVGALVGGGDVAVATITARDAMAMLQWLGASPGATGRRAGGAAGRDRGWWAMRTLTGLDDDPLDAAAVVDAAEELRWAEIAADTDTVVRLAVEDPEDGLAWAFEVIAAQD